KISSIYEDSKDNLWIGTYNSGLDKLDHATGQFIHYTHDSDNPNSISNNNIWSIYEDHLGTLWVGTGDGGLNKLNQKTGKFSHYTHNPDNPHSLSDNSIWSIYEDHQGTLWIGTFHGGLNKFDRKTGEFTHYQHNPDHPHSISDDNIFSIYEDQSGTLWIGTWNNGLNKFDRKTGKFTHYQHNPNNPNSLSYNRVMSMLEYPAGTLWLGTYGGGLDKFDIASETFTHYTVRDGLPNNSVVGILNDDAGNLWLSTGKGLSKFNPDKETFRNYDARDGLHGNEFDGIKAYAKAKDGEMFFGGLNGITSFYPEQITDNPHIPPILITDFRIFDQEVKLDTAISQAQELKLSYKDNFFSFKFAALDYANPGKNQYAYKLEGFDKDWIYSGERRYAAYTNLDPGTYTLRVKGSNNDGIWNEEGTSLKITIIPPPWKTWWAYTLYILAVVGAICGYVKWKTAAQEKENQLLRENERRLHQFLEAMPIGVGVTEPDGKPIYINQLGLKIHGIDNTKEVPAEEMAEAYQAYVAGTEQLYPTEDLPLVKALRGEATTADNIEIRQPDKIVPVEVWGTPIYDEQGNIIYAMAAFQDITARRKIEAERQKYFAQLQQTNEQLQAILDTIPGCVSWISSEGIYLGVNQHLATTFNLPVDSFIGKEVGFLEKSNSFAQFVQVFLNSSEPADSQVVDITINNSIRNYLVAINKYQEGNSAVLVGIDITEQKQAEESLTKTLKQKLVLLREVNHRVRTNLQLIDSLLDLQCSASKEEKIKQGLLASSVRVHIMALAHNTAYGNKSASVEYVIVYEYVNSLTRYIIQAYKICLSSEVQLIIDVDKEIRFELRTAIHFGLLAGELISNAFKHAFTREQSGIIEITLHSDNKVGDEQNLTLTVRDNGVGLPANINWQEPATLGLQIVNDLTTQLEGKLSLDRTQGTQFQIQFAYKNAKVDEELCQAMS
ncbi:MAG: two-component regulator propeller domain-containing protein, partial [Coleofasciculaceae cyanobacterium]